MTFSHIDGSVLHPVASTAAKVQRDKFFHRSPCAAQGEMKAKFLRHEGFLGTVGAFLKVHPMTPPKESTTSAREPRKVRPLPPVQNATLCAAFG